MNAIEIRNLSKKYKDFTLDNISFDLPSGCIMGLVGENGAGKSTTIKLIMNAAKKDSGFISVLGVDNASSDFDRVKEDIGVVLDEAYFPDVITAKNVDTIMKNSFAHWDSNKFFSLIKQFGLPEKKMFKEFSRGMKMKLSIATALSHNPKLLILDEATGGLDPIVRDEILDIFNDFTRDEAHSVLISSHIVSDLEKICDYVGFIHNGKMLLCEEKDRILEEYAMVKMSKSDFADIPESAVKGKKETDYGVEALVEKSKISSSFVTERPRLEDVILMLVKGEVK